MAYNPPPNGPPPYYGYPPPPSVAPGSFAYIPAPALVPPQGPPQTFVTNFIYPPQPTPTPVQVVENAEPPVMGELIDWVPSTPATAQSLYGRALEAGREGWDSSPLWIIRAYHKGDLVPGKLAIKHRAAFIPFSRRELPVHNFEVLCAPSNMVQWISANNGEVPPSAIIAGNTHTAEPLYIGRVYHKGSITPGKVHPSHGCCYVSYGGTEVQYKQYEVLARRDNW
ncbi:unnamed protein product, partial [Brenthis ino]